MLALVIIHDDLWHKFVGVPAGPFPITFLPVFFCPLGELEWGPTTLSLPSGSPLLKTPVLVTTSLESEGGGHCCDFTCHNAMCVSGLVPPVPAN